MKHAIHIKKFNTYFEDIQSIRDFREAHISPDKTDDEFEDIEYKSTDRFGCKMLQRDVKRHIFPKFLEHHAME